MSASDAEALAAARAEFWSRWRGASSCSAASRRQPARCAHTNDAASKPPAAPKMSAATRRKAGALLARFERLIAAELARCEACMTPEEWRAHRQWVEEHARGSLWEALERRTHTGTL